MKFLATLAIVCLFAANAFAADVAILLPTEVKLSSPVGRQSLIVQRQDAAGNLREQLANIELSSSDERIVRIEENQAVPVANGTATITAGGRLDGKEFSLTSKVTVTNQKEPFAWSFRNHVESVLSKQGCNGGACHGARAGQKGFRLTLFGFDVDADYSYLTKQAVGRRIVPSDPGRSLILTKPTGLLPHKGGVRLDPDSPE